MNLYKRGEVYWIEWVQDGTRNRISTHVRSRDAAETILAQMQAARREGRRIKEGQKPIQALDDILNQIRKLYGGCEGDVVSTEPDKEIKTGTLLTVAWSIYETNLEALGKTPSHMTMYRRHNEFVRFIKWLEKDWPAVRSVQGVNGAVAMAYAVSLKSEGKSTKTRKNILGELNAIWKVLEKSCATSNPWTNITPRDTDGKVGEAFTREEEVRVFEAAKSVGKDWYQVCMIMRHSGLRYADVARLKWSEIDFARNIINRIPSKTERHGIAVHIPIITTLQFMLKGMKKDGEYLFPLHAELYGDRGRAAREALSFQEVLTVAGVTRDGITIHSWRHTFNTRLAEAGVDKETRKRLSGHTQDATSDRYNHAEYYVADLKAIESAA